MPLAPRAAVTPSLDLMQRKWQKHMAAKEGGLARLPFCGQLAVGTVKVSFSALKTKYTPPIFSF